MTGVRPCLVALTILLARVWTESLCTTPVDVDPLEMGQDGIFLTETSNVVKPDEVESELSEREAADESISAIASGVSKLQASGEPIESDIIRMTMVSKYGPWTTLKFVYVYLLLLIDTVVTNQGGSETVDEQTRLELQSYYQACPYRAWWLLRSQWYFLFQTSNGVEYCWAYYHWWYTSCGQKYCNISFKIPWFWHHYHRCFPERRRVWFWALCLTIDASGQRVYRNKFIFRYLPRGCCCRRYWRQLTALQCPI